MDYLFGLLGILVTIVVSYYGHKLNKIGIQRMKYDIFKDFNKRYDDLNEKLNRIANDEVIADNDDYINDYLNLCAEEYLWKEKDLIDNDIWESWCAGMGFYFMKPPFKTKIENELKENKNSYYGFFDSSYFKKLYISK